MKKKSCFCHSCCVDGSCPNAQIESMDDKYGYGIAEDVGMKKIKCSECIYFSDDCKDCIFEETDYCSQKGKDVIDNQPTSDVVEIVRCKDCKYYHSSFCEVWSKYGTIQTRENGYCYMAERK